MIKLGQSSKLAKKIKEKSGHFKAMMIVQAFVNDILALEDSFSAAKKHHFAPQLI